MYTEVLDACISIMPHSFVFVYFSQNVNEAVKKDTLKTYVVLQYTFI